MIENRLQLKKILERIKLGKSTDEDLAILREALKLDSDGRPCIQIGRDNINIGTANDITIQHSYDSLDSEIIRKTLEELLEQQDTIHNRHIRQLHRFEKTNRCFELLQNPKKFGFVSTFKLLITHIRDLILLLLGPYTLLSNPISDNAVVFFIINIPLSIVLLIFIIYLIRQIIKYSRKICRGEYITKANHVEAIPVVVIQLHRTNDKLARVVFSDSHNQRYSAVPHSNFDGSILCETDLGVAYLQKRKSDPESDAKYVLVGFELE